MRLEEELILLVNNERLSYLDENITLGEKRFNDCSRINVVDISNLIGS